MLGERNLRGMIEKAFNKIYEDLSVKIDKNNNDKIHAIEAAHCTRLSYYERKDPLPLDDSSKISVMLGDGIRHGLTNVHGEYKVDDNITLEVNADMIIANEFVVRFEVVPTLPETPHPRHLLYLNACLFALNKNDGFLIYITADAKSVEFSLTKNNRMFEEIVRRARVLNMLLKENKVPIVEPCDLCLNCRYYERCYAREKRGKSLMLLESLFGEKEEK